MYKSQGLGISIVSLTLLVLLAGLVSATPANAQGRGLYLPGMNSTNSGIMPAPGVSYVNYFSYFSFDRLKGRSGDPVSVNGTLGVLVDQNIIVYVAKHKILGANFAAMADLPFANNSLSAVRFGAISGGAGFADSYFQPVTLGWHFSRVDVQAAYGFFAATGRYTPGADNNIGTGYWGNAISAGDTFYLTKNKGLALSTFQMYEFHTKKEGYDLTPGQTFDLDYSLTQMLPINMKQEVFLQVGVAGYGQWQTTDNGGTFTIPGYQPFKYGVNAVGVAANVVALKQRVNVGLRYYWEYGAKATVEGQSLQITAAITF